MDGTDVASVSFAGNGAKAPELGTRGRSGRSGGVPARALPARALTYRSPGSGINSASERTARSVTSLCLSGSDARECLTSRERFSWSPTRLSAPSCSQILLGGHDCTAS